MQDIIFKMKLMSIFYVEGFRDLAWAVPLNAYDFPVASINSMEDFALAVKAFTKKINIVPSPNIQTKLL